MSDPFKVKFVFANHDGLIVEVEVTEGQTGKEMKDMLMEKWPEESKYFLLMHDAAAWVTFVSIQSWKK